MDDYRARAAPRPSTTRGTTRTKKRAAGSTPRGRGRYLLISALFWLAIALAAHVAGCGTTGTATSLAPPPVPSDDAIAEIEALAAQPDMLNLVLWLDEQERYFEAVECWMGMKSAVDCELE